MSLKLEKVQTGIASEFYVAGELSRLGYNVTLTFGNTKSIDLLIHRDASVFKVQVKGIQATKSICWNIDKNKVSADIIYVLVNLHINHPKMKPDFFVLTGAEVLAMFKSTPKGGDARSYLDYRNLYKMQIYQDRWSTFGSPEMIIETVETN